jgi:drug/metabolite transporter (DMT)-like permease
VAVRFPDRLFFTRHEPFRKALTGGLLFVALYTALLNIGERTVSAGAASFIINVAPIMTAIMAMPLLGERFSFVAWVGTFLSFFGIGIIALGEGQGLRFDHGALLILGSALCTAVNTIVQKPLFTHHKPLTVAASNMVLGALCLSPFLANGLAEASVANAAGLAAVIYLGIVPSLIAYASWAVALSRLPAGRASNFLYCVPPVATRIGFVWLGEVPTPLGIVGGVLALGGVVVVNLKR